MRSPTAVRWGTAALLVVAATPALAGINTLFRGDFETGDLTPWEQRTRYVVFEGFYNHG